MTLSSRRRAPERSNSKLSCPQPDTDAPPPSKTRRRVGKGAITSKEQVALSSLFFMFCWCLYSYQHNMPAGITPRVSEFRSHPLEIEYDHKRNEAFTARKLSYEMSKPAAKGYPISSKPGPPDNDVCQPMHEWQTSMFPSCNNLHEIDMMPKEGSFIFIHCGAARCAFKVRISDGTAVALKIPRFRRSYDSWDHQIARKDGLALERLQASHYIVDIYGFCGLSQLLELGDGGALHDLIKIARLKGKDDMAPVDRLKIGIQIASAVSDLHTFEKDGVPSIAHNDICCHQFVRVNGVYKLNDFHLGKFEKKNRDTGEACIGETDFPSRYALVHSPEENMNSHVWHEKTDDYMAGNVMYYVLTKQWLFEEKSSYKEALKKLVNGERSPFPDRIKDSKDRADQAFMKGIQMLWTHNVDERPTSRQVANFLIEELRKIEGMDEDMGVVRVENLPPLPKNHRYTEEDYENNLEGRYSGDDDV